MALLVAGAALAWMAPDFASLSQELDGLVYHSIATRLSEGHGSFWYLPYFESHITRFVDHPPLGIYLYSLWIKLIGASAAALKALALLVAGVIVALINRLSALSGAPAWPASLAFVTLPAVSATLPFLFLDNLIALTSLCAVLCCWHAQARWPWALAFGACIFAGLLIKGPVALFTLAAPLGLWWTTRSVRRPLLTGCIALATVIVLAACLLAFSPAALEHLHGYLNQQLVPSLAGARGVDNNRLDQLVNLLTQALTATIVLALVARGVAFPRSARLWLTLALAGTLPLFASPRHYEHYLLPALPFFALAAASLVRELRRWEILYRSRHLFGTGLVLIAIVLGTYFWNKPSQHERDLAALERIAARVPAGEPIAFCPETASLRIRAYIAAYQHRPLVHAAGQTTPPATNWLICSQAEARSAGIHLRRDVYLWPPVQEQ